MNRGRREQGACSRFMKKIIVIVLNVFSVFNVGTAFAQSRQNVIDEVVWVVGNEAILRSDVETARLDAQMSGQRLNGDPYCVLPEQLAIQKLFLHQAAIDSVEITDGEVMQQVEYRLQYYIEQVGSKEKLEEYQNKSINEIRELLFTMIKESQMVNEVKRSLVEGIQVTPAQVRRYFKDMPEDSIPFVPTQYELQIIQLNPVISQEEIDRVKNDLREYTERVNSGKDKFSTLARLYSEDGSAVRGGELGFKSRTMLVPEFSAVAFNLTSPNTVSKIVESEYGFHIIQLIEKRGDQVNCRHILRKPKVSSEALTEAINALDSIVMDIDSGKYTFEEAASVYSQDKDTRNNYGIMTKKDSESGMVVDSRLELRDLPTAVAGAVSSMNEGEISKPFIMISNQGKEVCAVVKVKKRIEGHRANMSEDYQVLQDIVLEKLSEEKLDHWIREKQKSTYVRINPSWQNCEFQYPGWIKE